MPVATRKLETVRHDLKSLEGGWVDLRQLSYDEMLERRDGATQILMERGVRNAENQQMNVKILNRWSNQFSFPRCIVDHNLEDDNGVKLIFSERMIDQVFKVLDPKVGAEIERLIDEMNQEEETENFTPASSSSSQDGASEPPNSSEAS